MTQKQSQDRENFISQLAFSPAMIMDFTSAFSLISNDKPTFAPSKTLSSEFGLFGGESQYNHFTPGVKAEHWQPNDDEDFIYPTFRILSDTTVVKFGVPIHFGGDVLRRYVKAIEGQTVYPDHKNDEVGNSLGTVLRAWWEDSYKANGVEVPAGISAVLKLDAVSNPRIARAILMNPPAIHSGSVKVSFKWEKSHDIEDFMEKLGTYTEDGELIHLNVTDIVAFHEYSLVTHGADRFAQKIDGGKIVNPEYSDRVKIFSADFSNFPKDIQADFSFLGISNSGTIYNSNTSIPKPFKPQNSMKMENLLSLLPEGFTFSGSENVEDLVKEFSQFASNLTAEKLDLEKQVSSLTETQITEEHQEALSFLEENGGIESLTERAKNGDTYLSQIKASAIANFKILNPENAPEAIIKAIEASDLETARAFELSYTSQVEKSLPLHCEDCQSLNITRSSSINSESSTKTLKDPKKEALEVARSYRKKPSDIHK
jgi:hypothetical protein